MNYQEKTTAELNVLRDSLQEYLSEVNYELQIRDLVLTGWEILAERGEKFDAIRAYQRRYNSSLRVAKETVEQYMAQQLSKENSNG